MTIRFLGTVIAAAFLGLITFYLLVVLGASVLSDFPLIGQIARFVMNIFNGSLFVFIGWFFFFIVYLVLLQWRRFRYFGEVSEAVMHISEGNFDYKVPVRQRNEYGDLASFTNRLVTQLKTSMDEERRAEQTKNELVTNVSHDLRTPLTSIIGYLGLIEQDRYRDEVELRHYIQIAYEKSLRLNVLINDLFEYTRMRNNTSPIRLVTFNVVEMLQQLLEQYRLTLEEAGMRGTLQSDSSKVPVTGDPNKVVRIFENLLSNSVHYGKSGKRVDIRIYLNQADAVVEVTNYGEAIPEIDLPYLFDRFYRVDKSRSAHDGGSGLGLAIAKNIVEKHGGTIEAVSDSDMTTFKVKLPLAD
ncbi:GHKL domain-containing protein [Paenibacillus sp. MAHUQ-46]|uniref:histidine kinase n=2 Tax=Paenibacillus TaxID=44249 RepID=A0A934J3G3_9BACL|nr:GHKL domain-containing protein [Paenibacillus roseus]